MRIQIRYKIEHRVQICLVFRSQCIGSYVLDSRKPIEIGDDIFESSGGKFRYFRSRDEFRVIHKRLLYIHMLLVIDSGAIYEYGKGNKDKKKSEKLRKHIGAIFEIFDLNTYPIIVDGNRYFSCHGSWRSIHRFRPGIYEMQFTILPFSDTESLESFNFLVENISMSLLSIIGRKVRKGNLLSGTHRISDTTIEISVKFFVFCLKVVVDLQMNEEGSVQFLLKYARKEMLCHLKRLSMDTDKYFGVGSFHLYEVYLFFLILTFNRHIFQRDSHERKKILGDF